MGTYYRKLSAMKVLTKIFVSPITIKIWSTNFVSVDFRRHNHCISQNSISLSDLSNLKNSLCANRNYLLIPLLNAQNRDVDLSPGYHCKHTNIKKS